MTSVTFPGNRQAGLARVGTLAQQSAGGAYPNVDSSVPVACYYGVVEKSTMATVTPLYVYVNGTTEPNTAGTPFAPSGVDAYFAGCPTLSVDSTDDGQTDIDPCNFGPGDVVPGTTNLLLGAAQCSKNNCNSGVWEVQAGAVGSTSSASAVPPWPSWPVVGNNVTTGMKPSELQTLLIAGYRGWTMQLPEPMAQVAVHLSQAVNTWVSAAATPQAPAAIMVGVCTGTPNYGQATYLTNLLPPQPLPGHANPAAGVSVGVNISFGSKGPTDTGVSPTNLFPAFALWANGPNALDYVPVLYITAPKACITAVYTFTLGVSSGNVVPLAVQAITASKAPLSSAPGPSLPDPTTDPAVLPLLLPPSPEVYVGADSGSAGKCAVPLPCTSAACCDRAPGGGACPPPPATACVDPASCCDCGSGEFWTSSVGQCPSTSTPVTLPCPINVQRAAASPYLDATTIGLIAGVVGVAALVLGLGSWLLHRKLNRTQ
jgi:hypothetical protein